MYERNAIILERYFDEMFGYNLKSNIKTNFKKYSELVEIQEEYKKITEEEEEVIIDYDVIANRIGEIQKNEQDLNRENSKYQQQREQIFDSIDEDAISIQNRLDSINQNIQDLDVKIKENALKFINAVAEFSEKSLIRSNCGKNRKNIEFEYNNLLNETLDNYRNIDIKLEKRAKQFSEEDTAELEEQLRKVIEENGKKEKIPFNKDAIKQAIDLSIDIQKKEADLLTNAYEKTSKLFAEIKSGKLKIELHKKIILDSTAKQVFLSAVKEYLVQFLDNERLAAVNGENEYNKLIKEACNNLKDDLIQIHNLYTLLIKEITKKATKKIYNELYNIEYLENLKKKGEEFETQVKKLKLPVTIINPNYWRIEGMEKIYDVFGKCVTENYGRDLSEFIPLNNVDNVDDDEDENVGIDLDLDNKDIEKNQNETAQQDVEKIDAKKQTENDRNEVQDDENRKLNSVKSEIDRKIDLILGLNRNNNQSNFEEFEDTESYNDDNYNELDDFSEDEETEIPNNEDEDMTSEEIQSDDYNEEDDEKWDEEKEEYEEYEDEEDDAEDYDDDENKKQAWEETDDVDFIWNVNDETEQSIQTTEDTENEEDDVEDNVQDTSSEDASYDIWGNNISKKNNKKGKHRKDNKEDSNWEDEFVNIDSTPKKKKGFFNKFKK